MDFSLIVPCFNEEENLRVFIPTAISYFEALDAMCELVFVDDGSSDATYQVIQDQIEAYEKRTESARKEDGRRLAFQVVGFSRNFGKEAAMYAGLERATGDVLGFIDADMQQDPAVAVRAFKRVFYRMFRDMSDLDVVEGASDFRVFTRQVAAALLSMREHFRFSKGMFSWVGFNTRVITYQVHDRYAGESKWTMRSLLGYAWTGVVAFSTWPLRAAMVLGVILALLALVLFGIDVFDNVVLHDGVSTERILVYVVLLMSGIQMVVLGVFGEYLARAYIESKHRPLYIVRRSYQIPSR